MPKVTDIPPLNIQAELRGLNEFLDSSLPSKKLDRNVMIATWNIREFGNLTEKWDAGEASPKRDLHSLLVIAAIVKRFDIIAIQELTANLKAFRHLLKLLGNDWSFILTDVCKGSSGNDERLVFLFDTRKVKLSGLACELVVPNEQVEDIQEDAFRRQFVRSPYAVGFKVANKTFILITLHILYGDAPKERIPELRAIAKWLKEWSADIHAFDQSLITLGDFNIDRVGDPLFEAFTSTGLQVPEDLNNLPRMVYKNSIKHYDQLGWFVDAENRPQISIKYKKGGTVNFVSHALVDRNLSPARLSWRISDHLPLWAEFSTSD